jgi:hypothetical protein
MKYFELGEKIQFKSAYRILTLVKQKEASDLTYTFSIKRKKKKMSPKIVNISIPINYFGMIPSINKEGSIIEMKYLNYDFILTAIIIKYKQFNRYRNSIDINRAENDYRTYFVVENLKNQIAYLPAFLFKKINDKK